MDTPKIALYTESEVLKQMCTALRARRVAVKLTQGEAARRAGISAGTLQNLETKGIITLENLVKLLFVYRMEHKILEAFLDRDWWKLDELKLAEKNIRVRPHGKRS